MALIVEITPEIEHRLSEQVGIAEFGGYRYTVKSGRRLVAEGVVHNPGRCHFSLLLKRIAEDAREREVRRVMTEGKVEV